LASPILIERTILMKETALRFGLIAPVLDLEILAGMSWRIV
jgi:hypothetical protein